MASTAIECKLIRAGGTRAEIGGIEYHFQPYTDGAHVCVVDDEEHADRFLSIREGYRLYRGDGKPAASASAPAVAAPAAAASTDPELGAEDLSAPDAPASDERTALAAQFEALYGKKPHHNTGVDKLREMVAAKQ